MGSLFHGRLMKIHKISVENMLLLMNLQTSIENSKIYLASYFIHECTLAKKQNCDSSVRKEMSYVTYQTIISSYCYAVSQSLFCHYCITMKSLVNICNSIVAMYFFP